MVGFRPAERLNKHRYHHNWLHNLLVSAHRAQRKHAGVIKSDVFLYNK